MSVEGFFAFEEGGEVIRGGSGVCKGESQEFLGGREECFDGWG